MTMMQANSVISDPAETACPEVERLLVAVGSGLLPPDLRQSRHLLTPEHVAPRSASVDAYLHHLYVNVAPLLQLLFSSCSQQASRSQVQVGMHCSILQVRQNHLRRQSWIRTPICLAFTSARVRN